MAKVSRRPPWFSPNVLGFAAHWAWIWCVFWSSLFYGATPAAEGLYLAPATRLEPLWVVSLGANVVTLALLLGASRRRNPLHLIAWLPPVAALITCAGTLCISHFVDLAPAPLASGLYLAGSTLTGVGSAVIVSLWAERFVSFGPRRLVQCFVAAVLAAVVAYGVALLLPTIFAQCLVALMPVAGMGIFVLEGRRMPKVPLAFRNLVPESRIPWLMILIALFFGLSFGLMKGLLAPAPPQWIALRDGLNIIAIAGAAVAVYVTMTLLRMDFDHLTYRVALPLMAAGFLFIPLHEPLSVVGVTVHQFGYQYFYIVLWAIWSTLVAREKAPAAWVVGLGLLAIQLGQLIGSVGADFCLYYLVGDLGKAMLSSVSIFIILLVSLFVFGSRSASTGWGYVRPMEEGSEEGDALDVACKALTHRFHLTPREIDVFLLLARGRNRAFICKELVIGDETVKSHIKSIYRKMDVHSQQELINAVEEERREEQQSAQSG